jgi:phosphoadenosine phosphosulfate reductase
MALQEAGSCHPEPTQAREPEPAAASAATPERLAVRYGGLDGTALLRPLIEQDFRHRLAVVSSFGAESAVILAMVAEVDRTTPVLFIDTGKLFGETLRYRDRLVARLDLADVRTVAPDRRLLAAADPHVMLWLSDPEACCDVRKVAPLAAALDGYGAWVSGRKRYQGGDRRALPLFERDAGNRIKINPLAGWPRSRVVAEMLRRGLPRHPLEAEGYLSIGCTTCTDRVGPGEDLRAGRWRGRGRTECGIHNLATRRAPPAAAD